jgi:hypothetical protein
MLVTIDRDGMRQWWIARDQAIPPRAFDISAKPVTMTALVTTGLLLIVSRFA